MLWKLDLDDLGESSSSEPMSPIQVTSVRDENNEEQDQLNYCPDKSVLLNARKSDNYKVDEEEEGGNNQYEVSI